MDNNLYLANDRLLLVCVTNGLHSIVVWNIVYLPMCELSVSCARYCQKLVPRPLNNLSKTSI